MSRPSPVQPFASRLTRPIQSRHTRPDRLTASQASRRITPRLTTDLTTASVSLTRVVLQQTAGGCLQCVDLRPTAELQHATGDDAHGDTAPQTATFCVAHQARPSLSLTRLLHVSAGSPVPTADPLSRRYDQQDHCCCQ